jgi:hypothetical protein
MTVTHAKSNTIADWSGTVTVGNSTGGTTTLAASDMVRPSDWNSSHVITFDGDRFFEPYPMPNSNSVADAPGMGTWYFDPFVAPFGLNKGHFNVFCQRDSSVFLNGVSANSTGLGGMSETAVFRDCLAIYSQGTGSNVTRIESLWTGECAVSATRSMSFAGATSGMTISNYLTLGMISQINTAGATTSTGITGSGTFSTGTTSVAGTKADSLITIPQNWFTGSCMDIIPMTTTIGAGAYWMGHMHTTGRGGGGTTSINYTTAQTYFNGSNSRVKFFDVNLSVFKQLGATTSPNSTSQWVPFHGTLNTTSSNATANLASSDLQAFSRRLYWNFVQDTR